MADIELRGLTKTFGDVVAVNGVDLDIREGEFLALLGPSGCGKTTMLLMLAGIYRPTRGSIRFGGVEVTLLPPKSRGVGLVFQSYALYPHMTAYDNIAFPLRLQRLRPDEIDRRVREVARLAQIEELLRRRPGELSGGQQQRVALCRALVKRPRLLLLDEPLSNLDARLRIETRAELKRLQRELGITTILVTHDQVEAMTMADRIAVMRHGVIEQVGTPEALYDRPENLFVASFIGDPPMNLLPVRPRADGAELVLEGAGFSLPLAMTGEQAQGTFPEEMVLGVRPEHIEVATSPRHGAVAGELALVEPLGRDLLLSVRRGQATLRALVPAGLRAQPRMPLWLRIPAERIHLFDAATHRRVEARWAVAAAGMAL